MAADMKKPKNTDGKEGNIPLPKKTQPPVMLDYLMTHLYNHFFARKINIRSFGNLFLFLDDLPETLKPKMGVYLCKAAQQFIGKGEDKMDGGDVDKKEKDPAIITIDDDDWSKPIADFKSGNKKLESIISNTPMTDEKRYLMVDSDDADDSDDDDAPAADQVDRPSMEIKKEIVPEIDPPVMTPVSITPPITVKCQTSPLPTTVTDSTITPKRSKHMEPLTPTKVPPNTPVTPVVTPVVTSKVATDSVATTEKKGSTSVFSDSLFAEFFGDLKLTPTATSSRSASPSLLGAFSMTSTSKETPPVKKSASDDDKSKKEKEPEKGGSDFLLDFNLPPPAPVVPASFSFGGKDLLNDTLSTEGEEEKMDRGDVAKKEEKVATTTSIDDDDHWTTPIAHPAAESANGNLEAFLSDAPTVDEKRPLTVDSDTADAPTGALPDAAVAGDVKDRPSTPQADTQSPSLDADASGPPIMEWVAVGEAETTILEQSRISDYTKHCVFCPSFNHTTAACPAYSSAIDRIYRVMEVQRCTLCLSLGHAKEGCPKKDTIKCPECFLPHLPLLYHEEKKLKPGF